MAEQKEDTEERATDEPGPTKDGPSWRVLRDEIAEEPGNHGRFALGCGIAVAVALALFFLIRVLVLR